MGGDPACWLHRVCDVCGGVIDAEVTARRARGGHNPNKREFATGGLTTTSAAASTIGTSNNRSPLATLVIQPVSSTTQVPLGVMNVAAMAVIALVVFGEKCLPGGHRIARVAAVVLVVYGLVVVVTPSALPTTVG